jgi:hypothetical protein
MNELTFSSSGAPPGAPRLAAMAANIQRLVPRPVGAVRLLKFAKGDWKIGADPANGKVMLALADQLRHGWIKFESGKLVAERMGKVADGYEVDMREDLGDDNKLDWDLDQGGRPRDPWVFQYLLPMLDKETGAPCVFSATSKGATDAVQMLADTFAQNVQRLGRPYVRLDVGSYKHRNFDKVIIPVLTVLDWTGSVADIAEVTMPAAALEAPPTRRNDMDDEIPY